MAAVNDIPDPSPATLKKYGLSLDDWRALLARQGNVCAVCELEPKTGRFVVDHEHRYRWKKLKPEVRKSTVRGLLCWWCNSRYVGRSITIQRARNVVAYLESYAQRTAPF